MSNEGKFLVYCLENYKRYRHMTGRQTMELFEAYGVCDYIYEFYDVLHTTGEQYINRDIDRFLAVRNAPLPDLPA